MGLFFEALGFVVGCLIRLAWNHPRVVVVVVLTWMIASSLP